MDMHPGSGGWMRRRVPWLLLPGLGACAGLGTPTSEPPGLLERVVPFVSIASGVTSGIAVRREITITSPEAWGTLWAEHAYAIGQAGPAPLVDFSREVVIAIFLGTRPSGGFSVAIRRIERGDGGLTVYFQEGRPAKDALVSQALTQPFHIVKVKVTQITAGRVRFVQDVGN